MRVRVGGRLLALPVASVVETMRPLPIAPLADAPDFVVGTAQIRGEPCRVIDATWLLADPERDRRRRLALPAEGEPPTAERFVVVRSGGERVALWVDRVLDLQPLGDGAPLGPLPALADALYDARWLAEPEAATDPASGPEAVP